MITAYKQLNPAQLRQFDQLCLRCNHQDKGLPTFYRHLLAQKRESPSTLFYTVKKKVVACIAAYFFYDDACEVSLLVHPDFRRKKIATRLLKALVPLLTAKQMKRLIFPVPASLPHAWIIDAAASYDHTEYHMERFNESTVVIDNSQLFIRAATEEDIPVMCPIDDVCFPHGQVSTPRRFMNMLKDPEYRIVLAHKNNLPVGKAHIRWHKHHAVFSDIAIVPTHQNQGLGGELLGFCINQALSQGIKRVALDVEAKNIQALRLYQRHGFEIKQHCVFYSIDFDLLTQRILG